MALRNGLMYSLLPTILKEKPSADRALVGLVGGRPDQPTPCFPIAGRRVLLSRLLRRREYVHRDWGVEV